MNHDHMLGVIVLVILGFVGVFGADVCAAQTADTATPAGQSLEAAAEDLFSSVVEKREEIEKLRAQTAEATGEDRAVLEGRVQEKALDLIGDVHALADNVLAREAEGQDASADRERVESMLQEFAPIGRNHLNHLDARLVELKKALQDATPEERPEIEDRIAEIERRFDETLTIYLELEQTKETLGLDVADDRRYLGEALSDRAELLASRITADKAQVANLRGRAKAAPENDEIAANLQSAKADLDRNVASLDAIIGLMDTLGLDSAQFKQLLFEATGEITTNLLSGEVLAGLANKWAKDGLDWLTGNGPRLFFKLVLFLLILLVYSFHRWSDLYWLKK